MADHATGGPCLPLTIVTITRNNLGGLRRTYESLAAQTFREVQHVVIDGASTDGTAEWARSNQVFEDTIVVSEPDGGVYEAMNKGASLATGELLNFLNAGDIFADPAVLERVVDSQARSGWAWGFGLARVVDTSGRALRPVWPGRYTIRRHALGLIKVAHQATFMRTELFSRLGGFDERFRISSDVDLLLRAGAIESPALFRTVDVLFAAGGVSQRRVYRGIYEQHLSRRAIQGARLDPWPVDLAWTLGRMVVIAVRRVGKRLLDAVSAGRFTRWWAARGV